MASFTYTTLKEALVAMTEETGASFEAFIDTIIPLAEVKLLRDLDVELFDTVSTLAFTAGNPLLTKPSGAIGVRTIHYTDANGDFVLLEPKSWEFLKDYWPNANDTTALPKYFTDHSSTQWYIGGTPSLASVVTARCIVRPTGLSSGNSTTWLSTNAGDLLYFACLAVSEQFLKADERVALWKADYAERLQVAKQELKLEDRVDYTPMTVTTERTGTA